MPLTVPEKFCIFVAGNTRNIDSAFALSFLTGKLRRCGCGKAKERDMQRQCGKESTRDRWQISSKATIMRTIRE